MMLYLLQHGLHLMVLAKTYFAGGFSLYFNALAAFIQVLSQGRQLSIRDTFAYCHAITLFHHQNKKETHA